MLKIGCELDLLEEAFGSEDGRELGVQNLYRNFTMMPEIFREVNSRHTARAELPLHAVASIERRLESRSQGIGRRVGRRVGHGAR